MSSPATHVLVPILPSKSQEILVCVNREIRNLITPVFNVEWNSVLHVILLTTV